MQDKQILISLLKIAYTAQNFTGIQNVQINRTDGKLWPIKNFSNAKIRVWNLLMKIDGECSLLIPKMKSRWN